MLNVADTAPKCAYRGRFAPSPSGPLHFGSLVAAVGSYIDAKANQGSWLVRIEDIDTTRVVPGAASDILATLEAYGLYWDEQVSYQTKRHNYYRDIISSLTTGQQLYGCECSRKEIKLQGGIYQGRCRDKALDLSHHAIRIKQKYPTDHYHDLIQGRIAVDSALAHEDYIIKRSDGLFAYQLVVVLDDIEQKISRVVRGADLLEPTARQISLFTQLHSPVPEYAHLPLAVTSPGFKLSKQNYAPAISTKSPEPALFAALQFLGLNPDTEISQLNVEKMLDWAIKNYQLQAIPNAMEIQVSQHPQQADPLFTVINHDKNR
ncbi:MAG: tRNA glutamyl-Q(34) synthetase GluQRS [Pseudoalteromonas sp.]